ncbi:deoxycytidyl transferase [Podochytrium sp. JEL0797]|nr:deoxycytidyl transferase [Podochytrium sp. JEL0797]
MAFKDGREYMQVKMSKQQQQNLELGFASASRLLQGTTLWFDGFQGHQHSLLDMKALCIRHGAIVHDVLTTGCTHIVALELTDRKIDLWKNRRIVDPQWIHESIKAGKLLAWQKFGIIQRSRASLFGSLDSLSQKKSSGGSSSANNTSTSANRSASIHEIAQQVEQLKKFGTLPPARNASSSSGPSSYAPLLNPIPSLDSASSSSSSRNPSESTPNPTIASRTQHPLLSSSSSSSASSSHLDNRPSVPPQPQSPQHQPPQNPIPSNRPAPPPPGRESTPWALRNTSTHSDFIQRYYESSRLSKISNWKSDLRDFVMDLQRDKMARKAAGEKDGGGAVIGSHKFKQGGGGRGRGRGRGGGRGGGGREVAVRTIMHIDMDCFFASVGLLGRPELKDKPVVICHSKGNGVGEGGENGRGGGGVGEVSKPFYSTSEIASCNYVAREFGIRNGMLLGKARKLLESHPVGQRFQLVSLPYEFERYNEISHILYRILCEMCDDIMVVSCDEAYIDVSSQVARRGSGVEVQIAQRIRERVFEETGGCCASVGIGCSLLVARVATKKAKPDGVCLVEEDKVLEVFLGLAVADLPGVGYVLEKQMEEMGIKTCGELRELDVGECKKRFGEVNGLKLHQFCRGIDTRPLENKPRQTVGAEINWGIRFQTLPETHTFLLQLTNQVHARLEKSGLQGRHVTLKLKKKLYDGEPGKFLGCGQCLDLSRSKTVVMPFSGEEALGKAVMALFREIGVAPLELRGVGIHVSKLSNKSAAMKGQSLLTFRKAVDAPSVGVADEEEEVGVDHEGEHLQPVPQPQQRRDSVDQQPSPKRLRVVEPEQVSLFPSASQIDWEMVDNLPEDIRAEILALKKPPGGHEQPPQQMQQPGNSRPNDPVKCVTPPPLPVQIPVALKPPPNLLGRTAFVDVNALLQDWIESTLEPNDEDTRRVRKYFKALVENWESEKCLNLVICFAEGVDSVYEIQDAQRWRNVVQVVKREVEDAFLREYGARPCFI